MKEQLNQSKNFINFHEKKQRKILFKYLSNSQHNSKTNWSKMSDCRINIKLSKSSGNGKQENISIKFIIIFYFKILFDFLNLSENWRQKSVSQFFFLSKFTENFPLIRRYR